MGERFRVLLKQITLTLMLSVLVIGYSPIHAQQVAGSECGVYAMMAAAAALRDETVDLALIESGQFVGPDGSSVTQLRQMSVELGLWSRSLQGASIEFVLHSTCPVILNLRRDVTSGQGGHWVTFLGDDSGKALIFDSASAGSLRHVGYGELALMMTGDVILVDRAAPSLIQWLIHYAGAIFGAWMWLGGGVIVIGAFWLVRKLHFSSIISSCSKQNFVAQYLAILVSGCACGLAADRWSVVGFGTNPQVAAWVHSLHCSGSFKSVTYHQIVQMMHNSEISIIDARPRHHFDRGHIPGSLNFPIDGRPTDLTEFLPLVSKKKALFVYCAGPNCEWDTTVACRLRAAGISDIRIYEEGLQGFLTRESQKKATQR